MSPCQRANSRGKPAGARGWRELLTDSRFAPAIGEMAFDEISPVYAAQLERMCACVYMRAQQEWRLKLGRVRTFRSAGRDA